VTGPRLSPPAFEALALGVDHSYKRVAANQINIKRQGRLGGARGHRCSRVQTNAPAVIATEHWTVTSRGAPTSSTIDECRSR
jgi:hypothetical protein